MHPDSETLASPAGGITCRLRHQEKMCGMVARTTEFVTERAVQDVKKSIGSR
jgi:hypothetical protein